MSNNNSILKVNYITTRFLTQDGGVNTDNWVSLNLKRVELIGVFGESGSDKSITVLSLFKLLPMPPAEIVSGQAEFEEKDLVKLDSNQLREISGGKIGSIFKGPMNTLNPVLTIGYKIA